MVECFVIPLLVGLAFVAGYLAGYERGYDVRSKKAKEEMKALLKSFKEIGEKMEVEG